MTLFVYNTMTREKEEFVPISGKKVGMYACGITAYDSCHLGHARSAVAFDIVNRWLKYKGYDVTFIQNYTDIDDKIIARAQRENRDWQEITAQYIAEYEEVMGKLRVLPPTKRPRATDHIDDMIDLITGLMRNNLAYQTPTGIYFSVRKFMEYGRLSGKSLDDLESGARVQVDETKNDPLDFALWKFKKPGEPFWQSPWGEGRPGWHIECSAMSTKFLGQPFDIHGGGRDLIFPHHENELAQAKGANGRNFAKYWLHNGFVNINAEKMSKSLGNIIGLASLLKEHHPQAIRYFLLSAHYRSPLDYNEDAIREAETALVRFYEAASRVYAIVPGTQKDAEPKANTPLEIELKNKFMLLQRNIEESLDDDFNTARALGFIFDSVRSLNKYLDSGFECGSEFASWIVVRFSLLQKLFDDALGIFGDDPAKFLEEHARMKTSKSGVDVKKIESLLDQRAQARINRDFAKSDAIRDELLSMGVVIKDMPGGKTEWKMK